MSGQGGLQVKTLSEEDGLLKGWGQWVRSSRLGTEYAAMIQPHSVIGLIYSDDTMLAVDITIAQLPKRYKKTIKRAYWWMHKEISQHDIDQALAAFAEKWHEVD